MLQKFRSSRCLIMVFLLMLPAGAAQAADKPSGGSSKLSSGDADFIKEAAQGGMVEVELGKLAQEKASNDKVKQFGKRMEQDHSKANSELKKLASNKGVEIPTTLDSKHQSKIDKLTKLSGAEFDKEYTDDMVSDHKDDIKKFQSVADKGKDADLKKFASKTLPTLKQHLQLAESAAQQVKSSKGEKTGSAR